MNRSTKIIALQLSTMAFLFLLAGTFYQGIHVDKALGEYTLTCVRWTQNHPSYDSTHISAIWINGHEAVRNQYLALAVISFFLGMAACAMVYLGVDTIRERKKEKENGS